MADPKLKLGNDIWATKQKSLLAYNDEGGNFKSLPFQVDRISSGTYYGRNGLVQYAASNEPRVDFTSNTKGGLLLEQQRTNGCLYSQTLSSWSVLNGASLQTITDNDETAPDGTQTASTITFSGNGSSLIRHFSNTSYTSAKHSCSFWVKKISGNGSVFFGLTDTETEFTPTDKWVRYEINNITPTNFGINLFLDFEFVCSAGDKIAVWGMQFEAGTYSTSTIPTSGSAVTRVVDFTFIPSGLQNILNTSEGTLFFEVDVPRVSSTGSFERIVLSDQNASTDRIIFDNYGGNWRALMLSSAGNVNKTIASVTANQRIKVAIAYSSTELRVSYDGNAATTTTGSYSPSTTLESFKFSNKDGGNKWNGNIYDARYFDSALSNAELVELTS
jgi:hypothetical protein